MYDEGWWLVFWGPIEAQTRIGCTVLHIGANKDKAFEVARSVRAAYVVMGEDGF